MHPRCCRWPLAVGLCALLWADVPDWGSVNGALAADTFGNSIQFNRDIRPILSDACYQCHGPDSAKRQAELRLDREDSAKVDRGGYRAITEGDADASELVRRIFSEDPDVQMPPPTRARRLSDDEKSRIRQWIAEGGVWQPHWSLVPPLRPAAPAHSDNDWIANPVDAFVLAQLQAKGMSPATRADPVTLLRRLTLDLTGLPPTPAEIDAFLADESPDAWEKVVDRLLTSPRFGERMAIRWLNAARYADTNGYQTDGERSMWRWRDWVIEAYNANMPFDQFTIEQLAGDLLPGATTAQRLATAFNRNHRGNSEGGIIPEEFAVEYVVDRVETTSTVWLGLTVGCARCHDHKFDPVTQREFYQLYAFFNNIPEYGRAIKYGNSPPTMPAPTPEQQGSLAALDHLLAAAHGKVNALAPHLALELASWEAARTGEGKLLSGGAPLGDVGVTRSLVGHWPLAGDLAGRVGPGPATTSAASLAYIDSPVGQAARLDGQSHIDCGNVADFGFLHKFSFAAWINVQGSRQGTILSRMTEDPLSEGYSFAMHDGKVQLNLIKRWLDDALRVETLQPLPAEGWHHVAATYDGSRVAPGVRLYVDGQPCETKVILDELNQTFQSKEPLRIGTGGPSGKFAGAIGEVRVYESCLSPDEVGLLAEPSSVERILASPAAERSPTQAGKLSAWFLANHASAEIREAYATAAELVASRAALVESFPTAMVMIELPEPRPAHVLLRGEYDKPQDRVDRGVPGCLPALSDSSPSAANALPDRLSLAQWIASPGHPLTARVAVNRLWQMFFGRGLVPTVDDFGAQGEPPSHPELLDWLAVEFVENGWDTKALIKTIVTSATYRQTSRVPPADYQRDPDNRWLARGPRQRLSAEMIRDQALAASGLLVENLGGPSVRPYQPSALWKELADTEYVQDHGEGLYRRSLYTFWKRTVAPPAMITFDAGGRETCVVRESRTNTPLQALTLMNEVTFVEASRALAARVIREAGPRPEDRLTLAFRLLTARAPSQQELATLVAGLAAQRDFFQADPQAAAQLLTVGESPVDPAADPIELAAYTMQAGLIMNLDETITKE